MIVCHITDGAYNGAVSWLCNPDSGASAHFVVARDGRITQLVDLTDTAWGNGTSTIPTESKYYGNSTIAAVRERKTNANYYTISIEHEGIFKETHGQLTEVQLQVTKELIMWIRSEVQRLYGIDIPLDRQHIVGHYEVAPKWKPNCPGYLYPFDEIIKLGDDEMLDKLIILNKFDDIGAGYQMSIKEKCPMITREIYDISKPKARKYFVIGGTWVPDDGESELITGSDGKSTFKAVADRL